MDCAGALVRPALDAGEQPLDAGAVALDPILATVELAVACVTLQLPVDLDQDGDQILAAGEDESV